MPDNGVARLRHSVCHQPVVRPHRRLNACERVRPDRRVEQRRDCYDAHTSVTGTDRFGRTSTVFDSAEHPGQHGRSATTARYGVVATRTVVIVPIVAGTVDEQNIA